MEAQKKGTFELLNKTYFESVNTDTVIQESDLLLQNDKFFLQFKYKPADEQRVVIEPGLFSLSQTSAGIALEPLSIKTQKLLGSVNNTQIIKNEANIFFNNLHVYKEMEIENVTRKLLLYSDPGMGKSATITEYCLNATIEDPGTVVMIWPTGSVRSDTLLPFLATNTIYEAKCTRLILVAEDIGGGAREGSGNARSVDAAMLELLDGISNPFKLPTLIIATTNYPQNLLSALADRPGRFDNIVKLSPPSATERVEIVEFFAKRTLTEEEIEVIKDKSLNKFSIAHLKELVIRSKLHQKSLKACVQELVDHSKLFKKGFDEKSGSLGF